MTVRIEPLHLSFDVAAAPEQAFDVWTRRTSTWWPADHTATGEEGLELIFEPHVGGRLFQRDDAGSEIDWGEILAWEPPRRVVYSWHLRADRADATEVEILFLPREDGTRVEILHRGWERLGDRGIERRDANLGGWRTLLPHYVEAAGGVASGGS